MKFLRKAAVTAAAIAAVIAGSMSPAQAVLPNDVVVAVAGINGPMYKLTPTGWLNMGGIIVTAPAVARGGGLTHYIAMGSNKTLYHRTDSTGWAAMQPTGVQCSHATALATGGTVYIACTGLNKALYTLSFPASQTNPFPTNLTKLGGVIDGPAAILNTGAGLRYLVKGGAYDADDDGIIDYNLYTNNGTGWSRWDGYCSTPPGGTQTPDLLVVTCGRSYLDGTRDIAIYTDDGTGVWESYAAGATDYAPAVAATGSTTSALIVLQGTNGAVYTRGVQHQDVGTAWVKEGGVVKYGVGAATTL